MNDETSAETKIAKEWISGIIARAPAAGNMDVWNIDLFDVIPLAGLRLIFAGSGRILCSYRVRASVADEGGNWHSGAIAAVIDDIGAAAIMSVVGEITLSVDFSISFFSTAKIDDEMEIEANIVGKKGRLLAVTVEIRNKKTGKIVAAGRQWMSILRHFHRSSL